MNRLVLIFFLVFVITFQAFSQDSLKTNSVQKDMLPVYLSAVVPGAGQVYNGKWWKVPIIYAALGTTVYYYTVTDYQYEVLLHDMVAVQNGFSYTVSGITDLSTLRSQKDQYRSYRDFSTLGIALTWLLNVVDAYVDAEFKNFDVSPDLSFDWDIKPMYDVTTGSYVYGLSLRVAF